MSFLWDATEDGSGSAARSSRWRPDRIPQRVRNLALAVIVGALVAYLAAHVLFGSSSKGAWADPPVGIVGAASSDPSLPATGPGSTYGTSPSTAASHEPPPTNTREHAFGLHELRGLPPDVAAGTPLEIWVAWDEAISEGPQIQRLVTKATLARFIQPLTPEGPIVAVLNIPLRWMADLLYGQRYGSLSVTIPSA